jgi:isopenicillin-N N-acyltransferase-like protein
MLRLKKILRFLGWLVVGIILLLVVLIAYVRLVSVTDPPQHPELDTAAYRVQRADTGLYTLKNNWFRQSESGLFELYVEGDPYERGIAIGKLTHELVQHQEVVFNAQIHRLVPSGFYLSILKDFVGWFNRDLDKHIPEEYKQEIYGVSQVASHEFDDIASPYQRILNYHGAHDIGHALQNMSLVGCTSFATWGAASADSSLIIGRNFDFYVGDDFARDKIVAFYRPSQGYPFMMVTFGGMTGVLSGMNAQGLTLTINAAKSEIPGSAATPVSLVAREILQYASTIQEAYAIAEKRKMFVAESFLIGSIKDGHAAVLEKSPEAQDLYNDTTRSYVICTNHFQSDGLGNTELNREHMRTSASPYRYQRVDELLKRNGQNSVEKTAAVLRNQQGLGDTDIGLGNEKSVNQLIAHHAIIFQPGKLRVWVSTAPWQLGKFVCYDLNKVFAAKPAANQEIYEADLMIPADSFQYTPAYRDAVKFNAFRFPFNPREQMQPDSLVTWNPKSYHAYMLAGDYWLDHDEFAKASTMFERGLACEVATEQEREHMQKGLNICKEKLP